MKAAGGRRQRRRNVSAWQRSGAENQAARMRAPQSIMSGSKQRSEKRGA